MVGGRGCRGGGDGVDRGLQEAGLQPAGEHAAGHPGQPEHFQRVPGRQSDVKGCEWLADLLAHGLLRANFIPPREQRELRDLPRQRAQMVAEQTRVSNRIQRGLEDANIKLAAVSSKTLRASGRAMLSALRAGAGDPEQQADLARGRRRARLGDLRQALDGLVTPHRIYMLSLLLGDLEALEQRLDDMRQRIAGYTAPFRQADGAPADDPGH